MPELPDIELYAECLRRRITGQVLQKIAVRSPFLLRTFDPAPQELVGLTSTHVSRAGKRLVLRFDSAAPRPSFAEPVFVVIHLMIAGRLQWRPPGSAATRKADLAAISFDPGTLVLTEASQKKRAGVWILRDEPALHDLLAPAAAAIDPLACSPADLAAALASARRTLKRALTDPALISGIGNAYSDEILHAARLSPFKLTTALTPDELARLHEAMGSTLRRWLDALRSEFGLNTTLPDGRPSPGRFPGPGSITAFREGFAVHGRFGQPCPVCATRVQRVVRAENEFNYCPACQTDGRVLADRALSRLLKNDWPDTPQEWEADRGKPT